MSASSHFLAAIKKFALLIGVVLGNVLTFPLFAALLIPHFLFGVQFVRIVDGRIGEMTIRMEIFLRRHRQNNLGWIIGIASTQPCNPQLLAMYGRHIRIIQIPASVFKSQVFRFLSSSKSLIGLSRIYYEFEVTRKEMYEFNNGTPVLQFSAEENERGLELLSGLGIGKSGWFVCFHVRDPSYTRTLKGNFDYHSYRNADIAAYLKAADYITAHGGYAVRMGAAVEHKLDSKNLKIIDYAALSRTDFGDIFLASKCRFFFGGVSGISHVFQAFNKPVAWADLIPCWPPWSERDLFIPKKLWSKKERRLLTFREIISTGAIYFLDSKDYKNANIEIIDNTPEEIQELVTEMHQRLSGSFRETAEDRKLQDKFRSVLQSSPIIGVYPSRIGASFLRKNREMLE